MSDPYAPYRANRERFLELLDAEDAAAVIPSGGLKIRNADTDFRFRPESDFWYLTGFNEPDSILVVAPAREGAKTILFLRDRVREEEIWTGRRLGVERAPEVLGVDEAFPIASFWDELPALLHGHHGLVYATGIDAARDARMIEVVGGLRSLARRGKVAPQEWMEPLTTLHEQRLFKTPEEVEDMRRAAKIAAEAHTAVMRAAAPGVNEAELDALLDYTFRKNGSTGQAYNNIVAGGENACILHYIENDQDLRAGELLLVDAGAEWNYYASDITRTFPVDGKFSADQRALYDVVLAAQKAAIEKVGPGVSFEAVHEAALGVLCQGLCELGLLSGTVESVIADESYRRFYMHKTSHWLGLDVHDCGSYFLDGDSRALEPGMVLTVEPGLYVAPDDDQVEARWRGIGIRIEDDVLVTEDGHDVLTAAVPKDPEALEAACSASTGK